VFKHVDHVGHLHVMFVCGTTVWQRYLWM